MMIKNKMFGNWVSLAGVVITLLAVFAGIVMTIDKSNSTGVLASETKGKVETLTDTVSKHEFAVSQVSEIKGKLDVVTEITNKHEAEIKVIEANQKNIRESLTTIGSQVNELDKYLRAKLK